MNPFEDFARGFGGGRFSAADWALSLALLAAVLLSLLTLWTTLPKLKAYLGQRRRFRRFAELHSLTNVEERTLRAAAQQAFPDDWTFIFVSRSTFEQTAGELDVPEVLRVSIVEKVYSVTPTRAP